MHWAVSFTGWESPFSMCQKDSLLSRSLDTVRPQHLSVKFSIWSDSVWYGLNQSTVKYLLFESWFSGALFPNKITGGYQYKLYIRLLCNDFLFDPHSKFSKTSVLPYYSKLDQSDFWPFPKWIGVIFSIIWKVNQSEFRIKVA